MENSIKGPDPSPRLWKKNLFFFLKLDHFLRTFCKKCIFTIENPKKTLKIFQKMIKLLLDKQIFASSDAITAATRKILSTTRTILALTWFCHLSIYL